MNAPDAHDIDVMARTLFGEARGEPQDGQVAVAWTIVNRWRSGKWFGALSIAGVCQKRKQFSCWNPDDPTYRSMVTAGPTTLAPFVTIARDVLDGKILDPTDGATHYFADSIATPKWAIGKTPTVKLGHHLFFADID